MIDIKVPTVGESISEVTLVKWLKKNGDYVQRDEVIAELESEKATFEVNAEKAGVLQTVGTEGDTLKIGDLLASIDEAAAKPEKAAEAAAAAKPEPANGKPEPAGKEAPSPAISKEDAPQVPKPAANNQESKPFVEVPQPVAPQADVKASPVAAAMLADKNVDPKSITASGSNGKILKSDVLEVLNNPGRTPGKPLFGRDGKREKMSNLRKTVSRRLVEA